MRFNSVYYDLPAFVETTVWASRMRLYKLFAVLATGKDGKRYSYVYSSFSLPAR